MVVSGNSASIAAPATYVPNPIVLADGVIPVQYREDRRRPDLRRHPPRHGWYNDHQGYREQRRGYRRHSDGWWYPMAAFGGGAAIGGAIGRQPSHRELRSNTNARHRDWCSSRYRSYRPYDNTFVARAGERAECISPYL
ncbi:BA14K family protein [Agrobacterium radiobacter]|uniref:BA14K family protein n=2 Tax=Agrobacterium tumefaciens complex TaxID=1183400 RepID=UPI0009BADBE6